MMAELTDIIAKLEEWREYFFDKDLIFQKTKEKTLQKKIFSLKNFN